MWIEIDRCIEQGLPNTIQVSATAAECQFPSEILGLHVCRELPHGYTSLFQKTRRIPR